MRTGYSACSDSFATEGPIVRPTKFPEKEWCKGSGMEQSPQIGDRITDKSASPDDTTVRDWIGPKAFEHWAELRNWIEEHYPGVFAPDWLYRGQKRGWSLRYKRSKAFCTFLPEYRKLSVEVVLGTAEREKFEARRYEWRTQLVKLYDEAQTYPDGKWLRVAISSAADRHDVTELLSMKRRFPRSGR
ncbi:hypothetical protein ACVWY5_006964 [Bradyrhizobium sp. USDA 3256]